MKIATWNVNSIRARLPHVVAYLERSAPDVLCLQELKCQDEQFPAAELRALGYEAQVHGQKTYNGVAIVSRLPMSDVARSLGDGDPQARVIAATVEGLRVVSVYAPNGQALDSPAYAYKLEWYGRLTRALAPCGGAPLVVCGDFNVAPAPIDTYDPEIWEGQTLASPRERAVFGELVGSLKLTDLLRAQHPDRAGLYTWWDYRAASFRRNLGLRIDHLLASPGVAATNVTVDTASRAAERPSDHAPVEACLTIPS